MKLGGHLRPPRLTRTRLTSRCFQDAVPVSQTQPWGPDEADASQTKREERAPQEELRKHPPRVLEPDLRRVTAFSPAGPQSPDARTHFQTCDNLGQTIRDTLVKSRGSHGAPPSGLTSPLPKGPAHTAPRTSPGEAATPASRPSVPDARLGDSSPRTDPAVKCSRLTTLPPPCGSDRPGSRTATLTEAICILKLISNLPFYFYCF